MDQIFAFLKTLMEANQKQIFAYSFWIQPDKAKVEADDIGFIIFGSERHFPDGSILFIESVDIAGLFKQ